MATFFTAKTPGAQRGHARAVLQTAVVCFVLYQVLFFVLARYWPQLHDPEFGGKLARLRARLAETPEAHPFVLVLGSSHTGMGIRPEVLSCTAPAGQRKAFVFNFSLNDSGPLTSLLCLRRLLGEGIRPDWVILEPCPVMLHLEGLRASIRRTLSLERVQWMDIPVLERYYTDPHQFRVAWRNLQWLPWYSRRDLLLSYLCPRWLPPRQCQDSLWQNTSAWGWQWITGHTEPLFVMSAPMRDRLRAIFGGLYSTFSVSDTAMGALRELATLCQTQHISLALLRMPEARESLTWYPPAVKQQIDESLSQFCRDYHLPLIDARTWLADTDFSDGHHLTPAGATVFTRELERRFLAPILAGTHRMP